ncbi:hypothetical protein BDY24DRAFT_261534 [Mrakia frigida]|uniref:uncharacterized protein n=1 Tax=Mrakia frigida TaxID=29902 RepID=UPI003FCC187A
MRRFHVAKLSCPCSKETRRRESGTSRPSPLFLSPLPSLPLFRSHQTKPSSHRITSHPLQTILPQPHRSSHPPSHLRLLPFLSLFCLRQPPRMPHCNQHPLLPSRGEWFPPSYMERALALFSPRSCCSATRSPLRSSNEDDGLHIHASMNHRIVL